MSIAHRLRLRLQHQRGFSLLEVLISLAVFAMVGGALFQVLDACLRTTGELHDMQRFTRQVASFNELCRKGLAMLPGDSVFTCPVSEEVDGQELRFQKAPSLFAWGATPLNYGAITLAVRPQEDGLFMLALSRSDFKLPEEEAEAAAQTAVAPELEADEHGRYWLPLVVDLEWARWRFFDPIVKEWQEAWPHARRPSMIELTLLLPGDKVPYRSVFNLATATTAQSTAQTGGAAR